MKIVTLQVENVKAIKAVRMELDGSLVVIGGKNAQGKSAVLDAIEMALAGGKAIPDEPIRRGEKSGSVKLALSNGVTVIRSFGMKTGHKLKLIETATGKTATDDKGKPITQVQSYLNPLLGDLAFDPLEFSRMAPKDQLETLKRITGLDFAEIDKRRAQAFAERTDVKRDAKKLEGQLAGMPIVKDAPEAEVDPADIAKKLEDAISKRNRVQIISDAMSRDTDRIEEWLESIKKIQVLIDSQRHDLQLADSERNRIDAPEPEAIDEIRERLAGVEDLNRQFRASEERGIVAKDYVTLENQVTDLTEVIKAADAEKAQLLENAELPIKGLAFGEDGVTFNGIAFSDIATSEQIRASMAIGLAGHPELNLVRMDNGEALDLESLAIIGKMAEEADAQVIMARVSTGPECSVIIVDGEIADN